MAAPASSVSSPNFTAVEAPFRYAGTTIRMCARRVRSTGTTATSIVALYY